MTEYEKCLMKIELMKLKEYKYNTIENCHLSFTAKEIITRQIEETINFIQRRMERKTI